ncbi:MAG TPA: GtrA family protein [Chitinophagales bacterium]|jgi:putative flippase GtrA|nr:GtrA family protein [Chitinophagales bacterium]HQV78264.1 GtrA family protein [Chitinophagales bacterium]HQW80144.1 GtrA family protein [Chitinophagales bacterium]HRB67877.1 GtrA family protein [Chitinophagales bacterium]HRB70094.1 GtrA family protein [Chitinophagales bacterium]
MRIIADFIREILLNIRRWFFKFIPEQSYLYMACGGINLVFDMAIFFLSYHFIFHEKNFVTPIYTFSPHVASLFLSFLISTPSGFLLSKYVVWTNSTVRGRNQAINYLTIVLLCIVMNTGLLKLFVEGLQMRMFAARMLTCIIVVTTSYILQRNFAFKVNKAGNAVT